MAWGAVAMMAAQWYLSQKEAKKRRKAAQTGQQKAYELWLKHAYPSKEAVKAARKGGRTTLALAREKAGERIPSALAARGFGPSGQMEEAYAEMESGYLRSLGKFETDITKWEKTPYSQVPSAALPSGQYYSETQGLQMALGMMTSMQMYNQMYGDEGKNPYLAYGGGGGGYGGYGGNAGYGGGTPTWSQPSGY